MTQDALRNMLLTALKQARLAVALYGGEERVKELAKSTGGNYRNFNFGHLSAAALIYGDHVHLTICGSNDLYDWVQNIMTSTEEVNGDYVHRGFAGSAKALVQMIKRSDLPAIMEKRRVYLGGHSAGGAIAEIMPIVTEEFKPDEIYTFGSPKCMTLASAAAYNANEWKSFRFIMNGDPVPYLPLSTFGYLLGREQYSHATKAIELRDNGLTLIHEGMTFLGKAWYLIKKIYMSGILTFVPVIGAFDGVVQSHSIRRYCSALNKSIEKLS